ncbi:Protein quaking [Strongyloides ratti]|uniref:Protein quaking n=1 Tax=Strongyloides ratti TaxID=34506 RepID=A0A090L4K7_STRRB|nr:Protein quaking [Strongyloides ratti]CEF64696.1 Protein quaking [Strongyloides ratti]
MEVPHQFELTDRKFEKYRKDHYSSLSTSNKEITLCNTSELEILKDNIGLNNVTMDYLIALLTEKKKLVILPKLFPNISRLLDEEIGRVRSVAIVQEKIFVPVKEYPEYNFVGRILGPRGMTAKQLEHETNCKILVRGKGSIKDKKKEEANYGKPNWEHLEEELHVLIQCEDTPNRAKIKIKNAIKQIEKLLIPAPEGSDELKRKQLMELAIINGTYRPSLSYKLSVSNSNNLSPFIINPQICSNSSKTMSFPIYPDSPLFSTPPITSPLITPSLTDKCGTPTLQKQFDFNLSTFEGRLNQFDSLRISNTKLLGGISYTPNVFNSSTNNEILSYFQAGKTKKQACNTLI